MRSTASAAAGSTAFFIIAPGTVVGLIPWLISGWTTPEPRPWWIVGQVIGALLLCAGLSVLVSAFVAFTRARGTPAPVAPTEHLVVEGLNRHVRNPMYVAILVALLGQALLFASLGVLVYALAGWCVFATFVRYYEEPTVLRQFGREYETYRRNVRAWIPRLRPWYPEHSGR